MAWNVLFFLSFFLSFFLIYFHQINDILYQWKKRHIDNVNYNLNIILTSPHFVFSDSSSERLREKNKAGEQNYHFSRSSINVTFVHLPFSVRSLDLFVASLVLMKGTSCFRVIRKNFKWDWTVHRVMASFKLLWNVMVVYSQSRLQGIPQIFYGNPKNYLSWELYLYRIWPVMTYFVLS